MENKKLPIIKPPIIGLHYHAYPLSAVLSHKQYWAWFFSHYIQVYGVKNFSEVWGSPWYNFASFDIWYYGIPYISNNHMLDKRAVIENKIDIGALVKSYIERGWYTYAEIDDFFIPFRESYQKCRKPHDIFIFGYDLKENSFETVGFNINQEYSFDKLDFRDFEKAFSDNYASMSKEDLGGINFIRFFKVIEEPDCEFDIKLVKESINDYLNSVDTMEKYRMYRTPPQGRVYGMETYYYLKEYFRLIIEQKLSYDIRPIHLFWEHKSCMLLRLKYMCENNLIKKRTLVYDEYKNIENQAFIARNFMIKYKLTNNSNNLKKIIDILDNLENVERALLTSVLEEL